MFLEAKNNVSPRDKVGCTYFLSDDLDTVASSLVQRAPLHPSSNSSRFSSALSCRASLFLRQSSLLIEKNLRTVGKEALRRSWVHGAHDVTRKSFSVAAQLPTSRRPPRRRGRTNRRTRARERACVHLRASGSLADPGPHLRPLPCLLWSGERQGERSEATRCGRPPAPALKLSFMLILIRCSFSLARSVATVLARCASGCLLRACFSSRSVFNQSERRVELARRLLL